MFEVSQKSSQHRQTEEFFVCEGQLCSRQGSFVISGLHASLLEEKIEECYLTEKRKGSVSTIIPVEEPDKMRQMLNEHNLAHCNDSQLFSEGTLLDITYRALENLLTSPESSCDWYEVHEAITPHETAESDKRKDKKYMRDRINTINDRLGFDRFDWHWGTITRKSITRH